MSGRSDTRIPLVNQEFYLAISALVAMAELIYTFEKRRLPADGNLLEIFENMPAYNLLMGQIALHHCLEPSFLRIYALE
jgi:hypothetical protein